MVDLKQFENGKFIIRFCSCETLNNADIYVKAFNKGYAKKPKDYLESCRTVIVIANPVDFSEDKYCRNIFSLGYPGYGKVYNLSKIIERYLNENGYKAKVAHNISQKSAAVLSGIGVWGKNSLVLNEIYGTHLRLDSVVTDWIPEEYSIPLNIDLCGNCEDCINACPYACLTPYKVNAKKCFNKYIKRSELSIELPMCPVCQIACKYNKNI